MSSPDLAARLARLSPEQRAQLLHRLRQAPAASTPPLPALVPRPPDAGALPLSFAQQRLWFLAQLDPEDTGYHICRTLELRGPLQVAALEAALEALVHRHEALRTTFASVEGQPTQHISAPAPLALPLTDLSAHPAAEREALRRQLIDQLARRPFDLARGPLLRTHLVRLAAEVHVLVLGMHHIAMDGWSLGVLFDELAAIYGARLQGEPPALPALPVQYADYALWERRWLRGDVLDEQLAYWRRQLAGAPALLELSVRPRSQRPSLRGAHCVVSLPLSPARAVTALAQQEGASAFMALFGAFLVVLYLTTGEDDLVVGTPIAHRTRPETERLIGYFANTLALRVRLGPRDSFRALLRKVRTACLDAYSHQDVPFEKLVEELRPPRSLGHAPFFQLMFLLDDSRFGPRPLPGLDMRMVVEDTGASSYDVTLGLAWRPDGLVAHAQYSTDLFEEDEVRWLLEHLGRVVELVAAEPDRPVRDLPLLSADRRRQVLVDWNDTARPVSTDRALHELWAEQAARSPDAPAAICGEEVLSYRQLDQRAAELARRLRALGAGPGSCVALCFHRSLEALVSVLAVLEAGGHYLPLDPALPVERLQWMVSSSAARLVITSSALRERCASLSVAVLVPDEPGAIPELQPDSLPEVRVDPRELAYVLYTSGSTGRPKGVMVAHHALVSRCEGLVATYRLAADDRVLHFASLAFDVAAEELFPTWLAGACVVVWPHPEPPPPSELEQFVARHRLSVLNLPASYWHLWVDELPGVCHALPPAVRLVIIGSEPVSTAQLARWRRLIAPQPEWINAYGPTEATITATVSSSASPGFRPEQVPLSVGRPLANTTVYVLDDRLEPTPPGIAGELYLGGASLARGYLGRPDLTAECFLPHPHATAPGARLYRTGDRARLWPDGSVQLLGRVDDQIKLRGFRIEPGEVEAALAGQPAVHAATVVPRPHPSGEQRLVAYLVCDGPAPTPAELQAWLSPHLPEYMVPALAVRLDALPRTAGGKVDRQALPAPDWDSAAIDRQALPAADDGSRRSTGIASTSPTEKRLAEIWCEVLGVDRVGIHDSFFALGGHSLLAVRAISRLRTVFSVELPLRRLFESPTIERLAREVDRLRAQHGASTSAPLLPVPRDGMLALSSAQQRLWFLHQLDPESWAYNMALAHRLRGPLDVEALRRAFEVLLARHDALRTVFPASDGVPRQDVLPPGRFELPVNDLAALPPEDREREAGRRAEAAAVMRFDLASGPLLRGRLLRLSGSEHVLLLGIHHIVSDGWSLTVLWREIAALYGAITAGQSPHLPALPVQYADHAAWLGRWLTGETLDRQLAYWTQHLADAPAELALPYREPRPGVQTWRGGRIERSFDAELTGGLRALAHRHGATLFMVLLAALRALLARYTGQRDLCIGTAVANRDRAEIEGLIGMFTNTLVLRGSVHAGERFVDLLARERDLTLSAYAHAHAPFERVVDALGLPRSTHRMPLIQVMCVDQGDVTAQIALPGPAAVVIEPFDVDLAITPFDLSFETHERAGVCEITVSYNADLFDRDTAAALVDRYHRLLIGIAHSPERPLPELELLMPAERAALFEEPARRVAWEPRGPGVVAQIERWMAQTPDAPALLWEAGRVSYRELDDRSAALAALLRRRGVGPDRTVAVVAERGARQILAIVAVLRAGGAYVPIKPDLPAERIGWMLDETAPLAILCDGPPPPALDRHAGAIIRLDEPWPEAPRSHDDRDAPGPDTRDAPAVPSDALAYIIYTSGSTGRPKGVLVTRRGFDAQLRWIQDAYRLDAGDRCLQLHSFMFDASVSEIFWPLIAGGAIALPRPRDELEPAHLGALIAATATTVVHFVPSMMWALLDTLDVAQWRTVRWLVTGGEALPPELARRCARELPWAALINTYGPTETTVNATSWDYRDDGAAISIGRPVADTTVYVLDDELAPVPPGGVGQLWIGGVQLARGYLQRPALTAERFRPSPFAARPGERIYQTGDLVRQRADGMLDYLGRADLQVKVRGFRIELGEIEAVLRDHPRVRTALVVTRDGGSGGMVLVAYVCLSGATAPAELQGFLAARLPAYMIPSSFVVLDELPVTVTGKLDREALPAPADDAYQRMAYVAPATPTQSLLAEIWREVLGVDRVGIHDSFFALGGHSLLVLRLVARINRRFGVELSIRSMFESPTIAEQAERLARLSPPGANADDPAERELVEQVAALSDPEVTAQLAEWSSVILEIRPAPAASALTGSRRELADRLIAQHRIDAHPSQPLARRTSLTAPATVAQQLQWDFHQRGNYPSLGIHAIAYAIRGPLDLAAMHRAIADLIERQASLRTVFHIEHGRLSHTAQPRGPALDVADLSRLPAGERAAEARRLFAHISRPHDLTREVFRAQLVRQDDHDHLLFLAPHHIALDGFSWSVLEADLAELYRAREAPATAPELPPIELACRDFCFWQRSLEDRPVGRAQLAFWGRAVAGYHGLELPGDRRAVPRGSVGLATDTYEAGSVPVVLDGARWTAVERVCARLGCTPYVVVTSGFLLLLTRWSGRDDVCVLSSNFHRNRPGSEAVIGNFVTPYPLRASFDDRDSLEAVIRNCHDRILSHREHGHVAPSAALATWPEWMRYNMNYLIDAYGDGALGFGAASVERLSWSAHARRTPHDLALFARQDARGVGGHLVYNAERFSPALVARAADRLCQLIDLLANEPSHRVGGLPRAP